MVAVRRITLKICLLDLGQVLKIHLFLLFKQLCFFLYIALIFFPLKFYPTFRVNFLYWKVLFL